MTNLSLKNCLSYDYFFSFSIDFGFFFLITFYALISLGLKLDSVKSTVFLGAESGEVTRFTTSVTGQWATCDLTYFNRLLSITLFYLGPLWNSTLSLISPIYYPSRLIWELSTYRWPILLIEVYCRGQMHKLFSFFNSWQYWWRWCHRIWWRVLEDQLIFFYERTK